MSKKEQTDEYDFLKPCSMGDCTGLIPAGPVDEQEMADYEELYPFLPRAQQKKNGSAQN